MKLLTATLTVLVLFQLCSCGLLTPVEKPRLEERSLMLWMPGASSVQVLADWNQWGGAVAAGGVVDPTSGSMTRDEDGFWTLDISGLRGGSYRYVFLVNGHRWVTDRDNPLTSEFQGQTVSLIMIPD
jgi:1,4-alpha-glucan branching enzyme